MTTDYNILASIKGSPTGDGILVEEFIPATAMLSTNTNSGVDDNGVSGGDTLVDGAIQLPGVINASSNALPYQDLGTSTTEVAFVWQVPINYDTDSDTEYFSLSWYAANVDATPTQAVTLELYKFTPDSDEVNDGVNVSTSLSATTFDSWTGQSDVNEITVTLSAGNLAIGDILQARMIGATSEDVRIVGAKVQWRSNIAATDPDTRLS